MIRRWIVIAVAMTATGVWAEEDAGVGPDGGTPVESPRDAGAVQAQPTAEPQQPKSEPAKVASAATKATSEPPKATEAPFDFGYFLPVTPALSSLMYDISAVYQRQGFGFAEGPMTLTGLRFIERNAGLGKMTVWFVTQMLMAFGEAAAGSGLVQKHLGTEYGPGYRIDYYQRYSAEEVAEMRRSREATGDSMLSSNMSLDLQLYLPIQGRSTASGISVEITPLTIEFADSGEVGLEVAFAYTKLTDTVPDSSRLRTFESLGVPIRLMANWRFMQVQLQWTANFFGGFGFNQKNVETNYLASLDITGKNITYNNSPLSLSISLHPLKWLFVRATGSWNRYIFDVNALGYQLEAGVRL